VSTDHKIITFHIQLLSEDCRTDKQTDMMKLRYALLNVTIQTVLQVIRSIVNYLSAVLQILRFGIPGSITTASPLSSDLN
jgi:hypothetical protein